MASGEDFLNSKRAADMLGVHPKTLIRYAMDGSIPYTKPKGRYYFAKSKLIAFMNNEL